MSEVVDIVKNAKYLLQFQKDALLDEMDGILAEDSKLYCRTLVDEVFRKLFGKGIKEALDPNEALALENTIKDFTGDFTNE